MSDNNLIFKNFEEVRQYAERTGKIILVHNDLILDVTSFQCHHPGGGLLLRNSNLKDIQQELAFHHPLTITMADTMAIGSFKKEVERLISLDEPLGNQIWHMDHQTYLKTVISPHWLFVQSPRLFKNDIVEFLSHAKWYVVPVIPCMIIAYYLSRISSWESFNLISLILVAIGGLLNFSLVQYILHRFIFHSENILPNNRIVRYCHFFTHGVHHMLPNDPYHFSYFRDRLVLPVPLFIVLYYLTIEMGFKRIIVINDPILYAVYWSFFLIGYMIYDISHYAFHFVDTTKYKGSWFHRLQKYHNKHHFSGEEAGFGVSTPLWDYIMRTGFKRVKKE